MSRKTVTLYKWNPETKKFDIPHEVIFTRPGQYGRRGGPVCGTCGGPACPVLDGEAWCNRCQAYQ